MAKPAPSQPSNQTNLVKIFTSFEDAVDNDEEMLKGAPTLYGEGLKAVNNSLADPASS